MLIQMLVSEQSRCKHVEYLRCIALFCQSEQVKMLTLAWSSALLRLNEAAAGERVVRAQHEQSDDVQSWGKPPNTSARCLLL